eukprot:TRINITY_DN17213_c0_g1_i1.p1 TRINITY_DN17213_c0_g1~~TRINITY_DN17213_c0_g1_i1.p1  ORF type:complete len:480 (+),score=108.12 TRINITY_DN17213_c0_g1_i1:629-2068(+)
MGGWGIARTQKIAHHRRMKECAVPPPTHATHILLPFFCWLPPRNDDEAVDVLFGLEKKARLGGDTKSTMRLALEIIKLLQAVGLYDRLVDSVEVLMKRRAQAKSVQVAVIKTAKNAIDSSPEDQRVPLIKKLRDICQGKLHVELEFAQLSVELAAIWEKEGKLRDCADIMLDVQVETIGNMERVEKLKILLLQIRLNLDVDDYVRAAIMARKTTSRALSKPNSRLIKLQYYELMVRYYKHFGNYWYLAKCWMEIFQHVTDEETKNDLKDHPLVVSPGKALASVLAYLMLSPNKVTLDREQTDCAAFSLWNKETDRLKLVKKYGEEKLAEVVEVYRAASGYFLQKELIGWPDFEVKFASIKGSDVFSSTPSAWADLRQRVTEHNLRVISTHYNRVTLPRLGTLIDLPPQETEDAICKLVIDKEIWARVDRIDGIVTFKRKKNSTEVMHDMKTGVDHVLSQITSACHLIHKEYMINGIKQR